MGDDEVLYEMNMHLGGEGAQQQLVAPLQPAQRAPSPAVDSALSPAAAAIAAAAAARGPLPRLVPMGIASATALPPLAGGAPPSSMPGAGALASGLAALRGQAAALVDQPRPTAANGQPSQAWPPLHLPLSSCTAATRSSSPPYGLHPASCCARSWPA